MSLMMTDTEGPTDQESQNLYGKQIGQGMYRNLVPKVLKIWRAITSKLIEYDFESVIAWTEGDSRVMRVCVIAY
jgi:hypothetical protein